MCAVAGRVSNRIKDLGMAIRHLRAYIVSILEGLEMGWKRLGGLGGHRYKQKIYNVTSWFLKHACTMDVLGLNLNGGIGYQPL